jgi:hypothetical protein
LERATGIEPAPSVWKTEALPLSYARKRWLILKNQRNRSILWDTLTEVVLKLEISIDETTGM